MEFYDPKSNQSFSFSIPEKFNNLVLNCSGGADSTAALILTIKYLQQENRDATVKVSAFTCSETFNGRWNGKYATNIIDQVIRKTGFKNFDVHYTYYREEKLRDEFFEVKQKMFDRGEADFFIGGLTCNPPKNAMVENINGEMVSLWDDRMPERDRPAEGFNQMYSSTFYSPFANVDKRMISYLYKEFDAEDIFDMTRSCEATPDNDIYDENFEKNHCGTCWWCLERKWAFGRL